MAFLTRAFLCVSTTFGLWAALVACADSSENPKPWETDPNLPDDTIPSKHVMFVQPDVNKASYTGNATIDIELIVEKRFLWLYQYLGLDITHTAVVVLSSKEEIPVKRTFSVAIVNSYFVIELERSILPGNYQLQFQYNGPIGNDSNRDDLFIVYNESISNPVERRFVFEDSFYPFFDNAKFKVTMQINIVQPDKRYKVASNTRSQNVIQDSPQTGTNTIQFGETPLMRSPIGYFMVFELDNLMPVFTDDSSEVTVYGRTEMVEYLQRALDTAVGSLNYFIYYFEFSNPLDKVDLICLPLSYSDYGVTGGYLWGVGFYPEDYLPYTPGITGSFREVDSLVAVAHTMAHNWFAEIVTEAFNSEAFLDDPIASSFQFDVVQKLNPGWDTTPFMLKDNYYKSLSDESDPTRPPLCSDTPSNSAKINYAALNYKGAALLRMLDNMLGVDNTRRGYIEFVSTFALGSALVVDLWRIMQHYAPAEVNVTRTMLTWTLQNSYPLVCADRNGDVLTLTQARFMPDKSTPYNKSDSPFGFVWEFPLSLVAFEGPGSDEGPHSEHLLLTLDNPTVTVTLPRGTAWFKLNTQQYVYCRVNYALYDWQILARLLQDDMTALDAIDRANLVDDALTLAECEYIPFDVALNMTLYMSREDEVHAWIALLIVHINRLAFLVKSTPGYQPFTEYFCSRMSPFMNPSLWIFTPDSPPQKRYRQFLLLKYACWLGMPSCLRKGKCLFNKWLRRRYEMNEDIRSTVYNAGISLSGQTEWDIVWKLYVSEPRGMEKIRLREALCQTRNCSIVLHLFDITDKEDLVDFITTCADNPVLEPTIWHYIRENWKLLSTNFHDNLVAILQKITLLFTTEAQLKEVEAFFAEISEDDVGKEDRQKILDEIRKNIASQERHAAELTNWFQQAVLL